MIEKTRSSESPKLFNMDKKVTIAASKNIIMLLLLLINLGLEIHEDFFLNEWNVLSFFRDLSYCAI